MDSSNSRNSHLHSKQSLQSKMNLTSLIIWKKVEPCSLASNCPVVDLPDPWLGFKLTFYRPMIGRYTKTYGLDKDSTFQI